jgi:tripartite-type tricarboxylate transporter receptor subunit TctC
MAAHRQGKLRILALSTGQRLAAAPDFPTMKAGLPLNMNLWWAAMVPAETPRPMVEQLNRWLDQIPATKEAKKFLNSFTRDPYMLSPEDAQALLNKEANDWADYMRIAKIDPQD